MSKAYGVLLRSYFVIVSLVTLGALLLGLYGLLARGIETIIANKSGVPPYSLDDCSVYNSVAEVKPLSANENEQSFQYRLQRAQAEDDKDRKYCEGRNQEMIETIKRKRADDLGEDLALVLIGLPLFLVHFRIVYRDWREDRKQTA